MGDGALAVLLLLVVVQVEVVVVVLLLLMVLLLPRARAWEAPRAKGTPASFRERVDGWGWWCPLCKESNW
jgi:hypothetical protein